MIISSPETVDIEQEFGRYLAASDDLLIVGEGFGKNAYLYTRTKTGWSLTQALTPAATGSGYATTVGRSVAVADGALVLTVSVPTEPAGPPSGAYIFERGSNGVWNENPIRITSVRSGSELGPSVAFGTSTSQNRILVLLPGDPSTAVAVYAAPSAPGEEWLLAYTLQASANASLDGVAASAGKIVAGSSTTKEVFVWDAVAGATPTVLTNAHEGFGKAVAIDDSDIVVGAPQPNGAGAAFFYNAMDLTLAPTQLQPPAAASSFGHAVAIRSGVAAISDYRAPYTVNYDTGAVWVADLGSSGWELRSKPIREPYSGAGAGQEGESDFGYLALALSGTGPGQQVLIGSDGFNAVYAESTYIVHVWPHHSLPHPSYHVAIDPLALLLPTDVYVRIHAPYPIPLTREERQRIRHTIAALGSHEKARLSAHVEGMREYAEALLHELRQEARAGDR